MLCRTASDLYWLARHMERVDNTARLLDLAQRTSLLPGRIGARRASAGAWELALEALDLGTPYLQRYGKVDAESVLQYLILDPEQPSSIISAIRAARESGRAQRGAITAEMYEALNTSYLSMRDMRWEHVQRRGLAEFLEWVKGCAGAFRGVTIGTMGRDEGYEFLRLGTFSERADCSVRLMDVNFAPVDDGQVVDGSTEYYRMSALLQALSAFEHFRKLYRDTVSPERVAEFLILRADSPRSLASSSSAILSVLQRLSNQHDSEAKRRAGILAAHAQYGRIREIYATGLHLWLTDYLLQLYRLSDHISNELFVTTAVA